MQLSVAAITPGSKCSKAGATSTYHGKKYTCVKSGKKLVWNKGVMVAVPKPSETVSPAPTSTPAPTPTPTSTRSNPYPKVLDKCELNSPWVIGLVGSTLEYLSCGPDGLLHNELTAPKIDQKTGIPIGGTPSQSPSSVPLTNPLCESDSLVPEEWKLYQEFALKYFKCARPYRYVEVKLPATTPTSSLTPDNQNSPIQDCKISNGARGNSGLIGFPAQPEVDLSRPVNVQVVPIEFIDYPASGTPLADHEKYFRYIKDGFTKLSDGHVNIVFSIPSNYIKLGKSLSSYETGGTNGGYANTSDFIWKNMNTQAYGRDVIAAADAALNFSGIDFVMLMVPPTVPSQYVSHPQNLPLWVTNEKTIGNVYSVPPISPVDKNSWFGVEPFLHLHEMMHPMNLNDDHYGDSDFGRNAKDVSKAGTGNWGIMSGMTTDFILWDKWISRMIPDSEFRCAPKNATSTHWLRPSSYFGTYQKGLVIPISTTKVVVVESTRAAGFNFKLPLESQGALVYVVDNTKTNHGEGINVIRAPNREGNIWGTKFVYSDAPLKLKESMVVEGYRITVVESGDFGDVIKVEKV